MEVESDPADAKVLERITPEVVELTRILEREKTLRIFWVGFFITVGLCAIVYGMVKAIDQPPWLTFGLALLAALLGPSGVIMALIRSRKAYVRKTHTRTVELELSIHPHRESSETESTKADI